MKKRAWIALYAAAGLLTPVGLTALSPTTAFAATNPTLHYGSRGSSVQQLQRKLNALGFKVGTADGDFGQATLSGVKRFQQSRHLVMDGVVGRNTWVALNSAGSPSSKTPTTKPTSSTPSTTTSAPKYPGRLIRYGVRGNDVKEVQQQLNHLGFNTGSADGVYGPKTYAGVRAFQRAHHLVQDGVVGPSTWPILFGTSMASSSSSSSSPSSRGSSLPTVTYTVYDFYGKSHGVYTTESAAQHAVKAYPRGVVKDSTGKVLYTQTGYAAYSDPAHLLGVYSSWTAAKNKAGTSNYVVNANNAVDKQPGEYYFLNSRGQWQSSKYGVQGSAKPSSGQAQANIRYLPVTPSGGGVNSVYYPLEQGLSGNATYIGNASKHFTWENPYRTANLTVASNQTPTQLNNFLSSKPLYGLGYSYVDAEKYGSNAVYLMTHSILESAWGESAIAESKNNLFGYGAYDSSPGNDAGSFPTDDYAIHYESWIVRNGYLDQSSPSGVTNRYTNLGPTLDGMSKGGYATDPNWSAAIAGIVNNYADQSGNAFSTVQSAVINPTTAGSVNYQNEPVYPTYGYTAHVPSFPLAATSSIGPNPNVALDSVKTVQDALNGEGYGPLTVDGEFGNATGSAVTSFQTHNNLPVTGKVDEATWNKLFTQDGLQPGDTLQVNQMEMSFHSNLTLESVSGTVTSPSGSGSFTTWEPLIHFTNVYRVEPKSGSQVEVYKDQNSTPYTDSDGQIYLHEGDYVSNNQHGQAVNGWVQVNFVQWRQGTPVEIPGYVKSSDIQMPNDLAGVPTMPTYNGLDPSNE